MAANTASGIRFSISIFETKIRNTIELRAFISIMTTEVPTAKLNLYRKTTTNNGMIRNPPPTPIRPVKKPKTKPTTKIKTIFCLFSSSVGSFLFCIF